MAKNIGAKFKYKAKKAKLKSKLKDQSSARKMTERSQKAASFGQLRGQRYQHREKMYEEGTKRIQARTKSRNILAAGTAAGEVTAGPGTAAAYNMTDKTNKPNSGMVSSIVPIERVPYGNNKELEAMQDEYNSSYMQR